jgi:hypothetical protein
METGITFRNRYEQKRNDICTVFLIINIKHQTMNKLLKLAPAISRKDQKFIKGGGGSVLAAGPCPKPGVIYCLDVYKPVICPNGGIYSNDCYAFRACQTNCTPYGGDTM